MKTGCWWTCLSHPVLEDICFYNHSFIQVFLEHMLYTVPRAKLLQSRPTLCNAMDGSSPGSSVHWILQIRILEWVAMPSSRGSSWPRDQTCVSCLVGGFFPNEPRGKPNQWSRNWEKDGTSTLQWIESVGWVHANEELQIHQHFPVEIWGHNQGLGFRCHCRLANWRSCAHLQPFPI